MRFTLASLSLSAMMCFHITAVTSANERRYQFYKPRVNHVVIHEGKLSEGHYAYDHMPSVEWFDDRFHAVWGGNAGTYREGKPA